MREAFPPHKQWFRERGATVFRLAEVGGAYSCGRVRVKHSGECFTRGLQVRRSSMWCLTKFWLDESPASKRSVC